jgi:hypothetical protein
MPDKILVNKKWSESRIRVSLDVEGVRAEVFVEDFTKRITELILEKYPNVVPDRYKDLAWSFRRATLEKIVKEILDETLPLALEGSLNQTLREMKEHVIKIV